MDLINYYFTFGQGHVNKDGAALKDYWVRVQAPSYNVARERFVKLFAEKEVRNARWAFQYGESNFEPEKFRYPGGEYKFIPYEE